MPIWNERKDICLVFSGEDFTDLGEIEGLRAQGHEFDSENASYLVHFYEELGDKFFEKLNGRFNGVLVDLRKKNIVLFNDRYGLNRTYYSENRGGFYFSSEAKSLLRALPELRRLDFPSLAETFSCGCVLQNRTLFSGISLLPGGSAWRVAPGQNVQKEFYFRPETWENQGPLDSRGFYDLLKETWARVLPRYLRGKEKIAVSLTGGKDSRMIMAWAQCPPGTLPCYTFGGTYRDCEDVKLARRVAEVCQQPHTVITVDKEFLKEFPYFAERTVYLTDGNLNVTGSPGLFGHRLARQIAPIRLTGNYGQEILRCSVAFKPMPISPSIFTNEFGHLVANAAKTYEFELANSGRSFVAFKQVPWHHYSRLSMELSQVTLRSPFLDNDLVSLSFRRPLATAEIIGVQLRLIAEANPTLGHIETDRGLLYKPIPLYTKARHFYQQFTFKAEYAYDYGMPQALAKVDHALKTFRLERLFLGRHKYSHFRIWYREPLSAYVKEILLDSRTRKRPYLNGNRIEEVVKEHTEGRGNYTLEIHKLLTSELIQRQFIE
jgi:asparagine synthase (glutamine-hydrolysing)